MNKNTILAVVLSALVLIGYTVIQSKFFPSKGNQSVESNISLENNAEETVTSNAVTEGNLLAAEDVSSNENEVIAESTYVITTNKVKVTFTNRGGDIVGYELLDHFDYKTKKNVEMSDNITKQNRALSVSLGGAEKAIINDLFEVKLFPEENGEQKIAFIRKAKDFALVKQYTFLPNEYVFKLNINIIGNDSFEELNSPAGDARASYTIRTSPQIGPFFNAKADRYENRVFISYNQSKSKKTNLSTKQFKQYNKPVEWVGIGGKYFCELLVPANPDIISTSYYSTNIEVNDYANAQAFAVRKPISEKQVNDAYYVYVGPRNEKDLRKYNVAEENGWNMSGYKMTEALQTGGFLGWIEVALKWVMEMINKLVHNWGVSIIILTIILKFAMFPLTKKSALGTLKMQQIQPRMTAIQAKYKDNPTKLQEETTKLYKDAGYNPMSGCLPMILQMVLLFAMYNLFNNYFEFRGASFIPNWIDDLSSGDSVHTLKANIPLIGNHIRILPVIYLCSQLFYGKITNMGGAVNGSANAGQMKFLTYGMPLIFFFLFYNAPAGLLLFWTVSNVIQMGQQLVINKMMAAKKAENASKNVVKFPKQK